MSQSVLESSPADQRAEPKSRRHASAPPAVSVALLTAGQDKPYALGIGAALAAHGILVDFIGSDEVNGPELQQPMLRFLNLRGNQRRDAGLLVKAARVLRYYVRLIRYAATAKPRIFHILWNNYFELFDRTLLMVYYRALGRRIAFTAHNVNSGKRDHDDSILNRLSLKAQYSLSDHIFVHTEKMKQELNTEFRIPLEKVTVIPFGINNTLPNTELGRQEAREKLGLGPNEKVMLFFGNIAPYKGLEHLIPALTTLSARDKSYRLVIAGSVKNCAEYWEVIQREIERCGIRRHIVEKIGFIPDEQGEMYFKAADVLLLPYNHIFQSGVLFLGYSFGLPVIATDVGSLKEDIVEGRTGFVCRSQDPAELTRTIERYFSSELFARLEQRRHDIQEYANERYSWAKVAQLTEKAYLTLHEKL